MYSIQNGIDSDENRTRALKGLFATQTPSSGGVGVQFAVEESSRRPATGARNLNCILTVVRSPVSSFLVLVELPFLLLCGCWTRFEKGDIGAYIYT